MPVRKTGKSLHKEWSEFLRVASGREMLTWKYLSQPTRDAWNSLVTGAKPTGRGIEASMLPAGFIEKHRGEESWKRQYMTFPYAAREAAAQRLYEALSEAQRVELKTYGRVTFKCKAKHSVRVRPEYAGTTSVGCYSVGSDESGGHRPTTIGDFLLALKIRFASKCWCAGMYQ